MEVFDGEPAKISIDRYIFELSPHQLLHCYYRWMCQLLEAEQNNPAVAQCSWASRRT